MIKLVSDDETIFEEQEIDIEIYDYENSYHGIYSTDLMMMMMIKMLQSMKERHDMYNENPNIDVGTKYVSQGHFKLTLNQYTILNEFAIRIFKNKPGRMTVSCKDEACN